jgi:hypothetical protein
MNFKHNLDDRFLTGLGGLKALSPRPGLAYRLVGARGHRSCLHTSAAIISQLMLFLSVASHSNGIV